MEYNGTEYYYVTNLQGDVIAILDNRGECVVEYTYDAWGKVLSITGSMKDSIGNANPLRYRGYYYDSGTGFYYLQSRYYDPNVGRFINADEVSYLGSNGMPQSYDLFAYCENNPTNMADYEGTDAIILQATNSVAKLGHTGLLFQKGNYWYYWYWGMDATSGAMQYALTALKALGSTVSLPYTILRTLSQTILAYAELKQLCKKSYIKDSTTMSSLKKRIPYDGDFNKGLYLYGNFSNCYKYLSGLKKTLKYNLLKNNCMQTSLTALLYGTFSSWNLTRKAALIYAKKLIIPNIAYTYLRLYFKELKK